VPDVTNDFVGCAFAKSRRRIDPQLPFCSADLNQHRCRTAKVDNASECPVILIKIHREISLRCLGMRDFIQQLFRKKPSKEIGAGIDKPEPMTGDRCIVCAPFKAKRVHSAGVPIMGDIGVNCSNRIRNLACNCLQASPMLIKIAATFCQFPQLVA